MTETQLSYSSYEIKDESSNFYSVSVTKFLLLSCFTFRIYTFYWYSKNWRYIKKANNLHISPLCRSLFAIFFMRSFAEYVFVNAAKYRISVPISSTIYVFLVIFLYLIVLPIVYYVETNYIENFVDRGNMLTLVQFIDLTINYCIVSAPTFYLNNIMNKIFIAKQMNQ